MNITHHENSCFCLSSKDVSVVCNPSDSKGKSLKGDIALVSLNDSDFNGVAKIKNEKDVFVIDHAGEYEVKGVSVLGISVKTNYKGKEKINTIYSFEIESIRCCVLGAVSEKTITDKTREAIGQVDIVFVPIGGGHLLSASEGYRLAISLQPSLIIPTSYKGNEAEVKKFIKAHGDDKKDSVSKLSIKKNNLMSESTDVAIIDYS